MKRSLWLAGAVAAVVVIMVAHYVTDMNDIALHNVYRRLAYLPIVVAAFTHGLKGGLLTASAASLAYVPHAFFSAHHDPSPTIDKVFEIVLYLLIGTLTGYLVNRRDQARQALERSLRERDALELQLVRSGKMSALGQLTAGLAHEIRNPLASILGSAEALVDDLDPDDRKYDMGRLLLAEIDRLNRVVGQFVRFGRPNPPRRSRVDLVELAQRIVALAQSEAHTRGLQLAVEPHDALTVEADSDQLSQVLLNLLLNACQAADSAAARDEAAGRVRVRFRRHQVAQRPYIGVGVEDDGPGIPPELREEVFNPYFSTRPDGAGLGLAISNRIVEAHGGFMEVDDAPSNAVFFYLPAGSEPS